MAHKGAVLCGDMHLRRQTWVNKPQIQGDAYHAFVQVIDYCLEHDCDLVLMGDTFNSAYPDSSSVDVFRQGVTAIINKGNHVFAVQGQHDRAEVAWPLALVPQVEYVNGKIFEVSGLMFYGLDQNYNKEELRAQIAAIPEGVEGVVMHQLAKPVFDFDGAWDFDPQWLPPGIKYAFLGDLHQAVQFDFGNGSTGYYSGSTYTCKIDEDFNKSFLHVSNAGGKLEVTRVPLKSRKYISVTINTIEDLNKFIADVDKYTGSEIDHMRPVIMLNYGVASDAPSVLLNVTHVVGDKAILWPMPASRRVEWGENTDVVQDRSVETALKRFASEDSMEYLFVLDMLKSNSLAETLASWRTKMGVTV
jgi:DNA repair exonuclease SbcCD nuclease subunit